MRHRVYKQFVRFVSLAGSVICYALIALECVLARLRGKTVPAKLVVLCYHAVPLRHRKRFTRQMDLLLELAQPVLLGRSFGMHSTERSIAITFDDAYQSTLETALPVLQAKRIPCTFFVVSGMTGQTPWWAGTEGYGAEERFITAEQLKKLPNQLVTIGSHTMTHPRLTSVSLEVAMAELVESRAALEKATAQEVRLLAFPHGEFNDAILNLCRAAGFRQVFTCMPSTSLPPHDEYVAGRVLVDPTDWEIEFRLKVLGAYCWLSAMYRAKRALVRWFRELGELRGMANQLSKASRR